MYYKTDIHISDEFVCIVQFVFIYHFVVHRCNVLNKIFILKAYWTKKITLKKREIVQSSIALAAE